MTGCASRASTPEIRRGKRDDASRERDPRLRARACRSGDALPRRDRENSVGQSARRLQPLRGSRRHAPGRTWFSGREAQGSRGPRQGQRHDFGDQPDRQAPFRAGPDDRAQRAWRRGASGYGLDARPLRRRDRRRLDDRARSRGVEVGHCDLRVRHAGARKVRRGAQWRGRTARHLRRGGGRRDRPALSHRAGSVASGSGDRRGLLLRGRQRPQRLPFTWRSRSSAARLTPPGPRPASTRSKRRTRSCPRFMAGAAGFRRGPRRSPASARRR